MKTSRPPEHERRVKACTTGTSVVVTMRGYVPPAPPEPLPEVVVYEQVSKQVTQAAEDAAKRDKDLTASLAALQETTREALDDVAKLLRAPVTVKPVYDSNGKLVAAQRTIATGD